MSMPPTQPIAEWLAKIGLERCAAAFAVDDIGVSVLDHLTDTDSEKMRASLGHRRKMLPALLLRELGKSAQQGAQGQI
jgi:SAM domain (Sterile alpha motif)